MANGGFLLELLQLESQNKLPKPANCLESCIVGPLPEERQEGQPRWGCAGIEKSRKRRLNDCDGGASNEETTKTAMISSSPSFSAAIQTFLSSGCCIIPDVLTKDFVCRSKQKAESDLQYLNSELQERRREAIERNQDHLLARVARGDFRELVDRDGGRRDVRFQLNQFPFTSPGLIYNSIVFSLVRELLGGGEINLLYAGIMWAMPQQKPPEGNSTDTKESLSQKWHADGGHLFDHHHLPPHCINVFYPLIDLTPENGPTEVMPGTHHLGKLNDPSASKIGLCCEAGGAVLFDYRLNHRGGANFSLNPRPILYLCYAKPFFRDAGNTRSGHSLLSTHSPLHRRSPPWVSRILSGDPVSMDSGLDCGEEESIANAADADMNGNKDSHLNDTQINCISASRGSGERWVLFKMNVEVPGCDEPKIITVYHGDVASEVSKKFCEENGLGDDFVPVLAGAIDAQMGTSLQQG